MALFTRGDILGLAAMSSSISCLHGTVLIFYTLLLYPFTVVADAIRLAWGLLFVADSSPSRPPGELYSDYFNKHIIHPWQVFRSSLRPPHDSPQSPVLPIELLDEIMDRVQDRETLLTLARVCRAFLPRARQRVWADGMFLAYRHRVYSFVTLLHSPFCTLSSIGSLVLGSDRGWDVIDAAIAELAARKIVVRSLNLRTQKTPRKPSPVFSQGVTNLAVTYTPSSRQYGPKVAEFVSSFGNIRTLYLAMSSHSWKPRQSENNAFHLPPRLEHLSLSSADGCPYIIHWILSGNPSLKSLVLITRRYEDDFNAVWQYLQRNGRLIEHLGWMVDTSSYSLNLGSRIKDLLESQASFCMPNLKSIAFVDPYREELDRNTETVTSYAREMISGFLLCAPRLSEVSLQCANLCTRSGCEAAFGSWGFEPDEKRRDENQSLSVFTRTVPADI